MPSRPALLTLLSVLILAIPVALAPRKNAPSENADQRAIIAVMNEQQEAWNRADVAGFMKGYWNSPQLTFAAATSFNRGWETVLNRYKRDYPDLAAMGHLNFSELEIRTLGPDAALVLGKWHLTRAAGDTGGIFTLVFQRFPEGWRIIHDHTT